MATKKTSKKSPVKKSSRRKPSRRGKPRAPKLTAREHKIVQTMTKQGATMRRIAAKIGRAPSTIWRHQQQP
jgi:DNA-binding NarL/FixJ family response regulator